MTYFIITFVLGTFSVYLFKYIPSLYLLCLIIPPLLMLPFYSKYSKKLQKITLFLISFLLGFCWMILYINYIKYQKIPSEIEGKELIIEGSVVSLPQVKDTFESFDFLASKIQTTKVYPLQMPKSLKLKLSWYGPHPKITAGCKWQLVVRLKRPHGMMNPGGFDYERYLFEHHIQATGYIVNNPQTILLACSSYYNPITYLRQYLRDQINAALPNLSLKSMIIDFVIGDESGVSQTEWKVLRDTGTSYLLAISGLHIGFIGALGFSLVLFLWKLFPRFSLIYPASNVALIFSLVIALFYSAISGFSIPTQRAIIMLSIFILAKFANRNLSAFHSFLLALFVVILIDPLASLSCGFWLSFGAVGFIIFGASSRVKLKPGFWRKHFRMQIIVFVGILPLTLWLFQQISILSFVVNIWALPIVCILIVPLSFVGAMLLFVAAKPGIWLLHIALKLMQITWVLLEKVANWPIGNWHQPIYNWEILAAAIVGSILLLLPRYFPGKWLGFCYFLPIAFYKPAPPAAGEISFTLLDVGQGLAAVVQTHNHVLVYDTGPNYAHGNAGDSVILPFLSSKAINQIDKLVVSHEHDDHIGGASSILSSTKVISIATSVPEKFPSFVAKHCYAGDEWWWDGINFKFLYPSLQSAFKSGNNASCVLKITNGKNSILLTGDIEKDAEKNLTASFSSELSAQILVAPHHGSRTSSTNQFVEAVHPQYVLFPVGYRNRFRLPHKSVVRRYLENKAQLFEVANFGAITFKFNSISDILLPNFYRITDHHFWNN